MTAAITDSNSFWVPRKVSADPVSRTGITANRVAAQAVPTNRRILTRATGTPTLRAACASPPTAKIQLPNSVFTRIHVAAAVNPIHQTTDMGIPATSGDPSALLPIQPICPNHVNTGPPNLPPNSD